jgi:hypothetical protein
LTRAAGLAMIAGHGRRARGGHIRHDPVVLDAFVSVMWSAGEERLS